MAIKSHRRQGRSGRIQRAVSDNVIRDNLAQRCIRRTWREAVWIAPFVFIIHQALAAPDEEILGKSQGYPVGRADNWFYEERVRVGSFTHLDKILPYNLVPKSERPLLLQKAAREAAIRFRVAGKSYNIDDYLRRQRITGLLIIHDGEILVERYQYDRRETDRFVSHSMAKSITSLGIGFALEEGAICSLDDKVSEYVPELRGCAYGETAIRNLLRMSSGVKFSELYNGKDDVARFLAKWYSGGLIEAVCAFNKREVPQRSRFHYASSETMVLGLLLKSVKGETLAKYLGEKLWRPMGAEQDAFWSCDSSGMEVAAGYFSAVLRDYGRLGVLLGNDGMRDGRQILPKNYLLEATDWHKHPEIFAPGRAKRSYGYGYQFWTFPGEHRRFALIGVYGQAIFVDPELKLVMVQTAAAKNAEVDNDRLGMEMEGLWRQIVADFGTW